MSTTSESLYLNEKGKTVKAIIVQIISREWPLKTKQLHQLLKKEHGMSVTYQAVHKAANQLVQEGVLRKEEKGYQMDEKWIGKIENTSKNIALNYSENKKFNFEKEINHLSLNINH